MFKDTVYKFEIQKHESTYLFLGNTPPCTLILSSIFETLNSNVCNETLKSVFAERGLDLDIVKENEINSDDMQKPGRFSGLHIILLDGYSPKSLIIYNTLKNANTSLLAFVSKNNKHFFENLNDLTSELPQLNSELFSNDEQFQSTLKAFAESFQGAELGIAEYDFSGIESNPGDFLEIINQNIKPDDIYRKVLEEFTASKSDIPEFEDINTILIRIRENSNDIELQDLELLFNRYQELSDKHKQKMSGIFHFCISLLLQIFTEKENKENCRSVLKSFIDNVKGSYENSNLSFAELKNMGDACLIISEDNNYNEYSLTATEIYLFALDKASDIKNDILKTGIQNNLSISYLKANDHNHQSEPVGRSIEILNQNLSNLENTENFNNRVCMLQNIATAYIKRADISGNSDDYNNVIEKLNKMFSISDKSGVDFDDKTVSLQLSHAYHRLGEIEKNSKYIHSAINYYEKVAEILRGFGENNKYVDVLNKTANAYQFLAELENNLDYNLNAYEKLNECLDYLPDNDQKEKHLEIRTSIGDILLNYSNLKKESARVLDAIRSYEEALQFVDPQEMKEQYGILNKKLGDSYKLDGELEKNTESCFRAIDSYEQCLNYYTRENLPLEFANVHRNIGSSHEMLSHLEFDASYCQKSIDSYNQALLIYDIDTYPDEYYAVINNLGNAFSALSEFENKKDNCSKAIDCYNIASELYTYEKFPLDYAMNQNNLGVAYSSLAEEIDNKDYFNGAVKSFNEALKVYSLEDHPENYAMIQNNLGDSYFSLSYFDENPADLIKKSISCFEESKKVFETEKNPSKFGFIMRKLAKTYKELYSRDSDPKALGSSISANIQCLEYFKYELFPEEYALIQIELGTLFSSEIKDGINIVKLKKAVEAYKNACRFFKRDDYPVQYSKISNNLGNLFRKLSVCENKKENILESVKLLSSAADSIEAGSSEKFHAIILNNLGTSYCVLSEVMDTESNLLKACETFENSLALLNEDSFTLICTVKNNLANAKCTLYELTNERSYLDSSIEHYLSAMDHTAIDVSGTDNAILKNNYANSQLLKFETVKYGSNEDTGFIFQNYNEALKNINSGLNPGIYSAIVNNIACCNIHEFINNDKESYLEEAVKSLNEYESLLQGYDTSYLASTLKNNSAAVQLYQSSINSDSEQCGKSIEKFRDIYENNDVDGDPVTGRLNSKSHINLLNALSLSCKQDSGDESSDNLIKILNDSLQRFNVVNFPEIYASINFHLAKLYKNLTTQQDDFTQIKLALEHLENCLDVYSGENYLYEKGLISFEIGSNSLLLYQNAGESEYLEKSVKPLKNSLEVFNKEEFPDKNANINLHLANALLESGKIDKNSSIIFESIKHFETASPYFNSKSYPEYSILIKTGLEDAYELLSEMEQSFGNADEGIEYYKKLLDIFKSKNFKKDISGIQINLAKLYHDSYNSNKNPELLENSNNLINEALDALDKDSFPENYYNTLLMGADISRILRELTGDSTLITQNISKLTECLEYFNQDKDPGKFFVLSRQAAEAYFALYEISDQTSDLSDSIRFYKQALTTVDMKSDDFNEVNARYLECKRILAARYYYSSDFQKTVELIESEAELSGSEQLDESSANTTLLLGKSYQMLCENEFDENYLINSVNNLQKASGFFNKQFPEKYFEIKNDILSNYKNLFSQSGDYKYLNDSIGVIDELIEFCKLNGKEDECRKYLLDRADCNFLYAKNEFDRGDFSKTVDLCNQSMEFFILEDYPTEYAHINQLMGMSYLQIDSKDLVVENTTEAINHLNEAKKGFSFNETQFADEIGEINLNLEKAYQRLLEQDSQLNTQSRIDYLEKVIPLYKENESYEALPNAYRELAERYIAIGESTHDVDKLKKALNYYKNYISYLDVENDVSELGSSNKKMGFACNEIYEQNGEKEILADSIEYFEKSKEFFSVENDKDQIAELEAKLFQNYCRYGKLYESQGEIDTALIFYEKAVNNTSEGHLVNERKQQQLANAALYTTLGENNSSREAFEKAVLTLRTCIENSDTENEKAEIKIKLGEIFEKIHAIENDNDKLEKAIKSYRESVNSLSDGGLKTDINARIGKLTLQTAESYYNGNSSIAEDKYLDALKYYTMEKDPEKYGDINKKLADFSIEKYHASKNKIDGENAVKYLNSASLFYTSENHPEHYEAIKSKIKMVFDSFIEYDLLDGSEKEECLYKLRDLAFNLDDKQEVAKYNKELAVLYSGSSNVKEFDFDAFLNDLKESEQFTESENLALSVEIQYFLGLLCSVKGKEINNDIYLSDSEKYFNKFLNNSNASPDDPRAIEVCNILFDINIQHAEKFRQNGELELCIDKYKSILENTTDDNESEKYNDIHLKLGEIYLALFNDNKDRSYLSESLNSYRRAKAFFLYNNKQSAAEEVNKKLDEIFRLDLEYADNSESPLKSEHLENIFALYPENEYRTEFTEIKKSLGLSLVKQYEAEQNSDLLFRADNILKEVLNSVENEYSDEQLADLNMNIGIVNLLIYRSSEDQSTLDDSQSFFQRVVSLSDDEDKLNEVEKRLDEVNEIIESLNKHEESPEVEDTETIKADGSADLEEQEDILHAKSDDSLNIASEKSVENIQAELEEGQEIDEITTDVPFEKQEKEISEPHEVNFVMKDDEHGEEKNSDPAESTLAESEQITQIKTALDNLDKKESSDQFIELSVQLAEAYRSDAESGDVFDAYNLALDNYRKAISLVNKEDNLPLYSKLGKEIVSLFPLLSGDFDLREYKQIISIGKKALEYYIPEEYSAENALINKDLGVIHTFLAEREGELKYYKNSIGFYDEALKNLDKHENSEDYAIINKNLGVAYGIISEIEFDDKAFESSLKYYENSLEAIDEEKLPAEYALVNKYLGIAYGTYGERNNSMQFIEKSTVCYENALKHISSENSFSDYGLLNRNLGNNYLKLIETNNDPEFCNKGIAAYTSALDFYQAEKTPFVYASINNNIGSLYSALSDIENKVENCGKAIDSYSKVLKIYNINDNPMEFAAANNNLGIAYRNLAEVSEKSDNCEKAISCYEKALKAYTLKDFPIQYSNMQNNLGTAYRTLAEEKNKVENCKKSIKCYEEALKVRTIENMPIQFAGTQNNLGVAYRTLGELESKMNNCKKAIKAYEAALFVYTLEKYPIQYATTKNNLAGAYSTLAESVDKEKNYNNSIESYREAQKVFSENEFPDIYNMIEENIVFLQDNVEQ